MRVQLGIIVVKRSRDQEMVRWLTQFWVDIKERGSNDAALKDRISVIEFFILKNENIYIGLSVVSRLQV